MYSLFIFRLFTRFQWSESGRP